MNFESGHIYHLFNQGNNRQSIFFIRENYLYFLRKVNIQITPFADILAWCLMPNHFHIMIFVNRIDMVKNDGEESDSRTTSLAKSVGILLSSYTRAINKQNGKTGSLFRQQTKAICLTKSLAIAQTWYVSNGVTMINTDTPEKQYPNVCFNYILFNPLKAGMVKRNEEWEFSSYPDVVGLRNGKLISRDRITELGLEVHPSSCNLSPHDSKSSDDKERSTH